MFEMTVRLDRELRNAVRRIAAEEAAATKEEVSIASIVRQALRDFAARRLAERAQNSD
jgi:hypothetical protein